MKKIRKYHVKIFLFFIFLFMITLLYPRSLEINEVKPDFILIGLTSILVFSKNKKRALMILIVVSVIRDLIDFRILGPYTVLAIILYFLVDILIRFFYQIDLTRFLFIVVLLTLMQDVIWNLTYNMGYMLVYNLSTEFELVDTLIYTTWIRILINLVVASSMYILEKKTRMFSYE